MRREAAESAASFVLLVVAAMAARLWFDNLAFGAGLRLDVAIIILALLSMGRGTGFGIVAGFLLGLIVDATHPGWIGASSVGYAAVGFFAGSFGQTLYMEKSLARGLLVLGAVVMFDVLFGLFSVGLARPFWRHALGTLGSALLSGAAAVLAARAYRWWRGRTAAEEGSAGDG